MFAAPHADKSDNFSLRRISSAAQLQSEVRDHEMSNMDDGAPPLQAYPV